MTLDEYNAKAATATAENFQSVITDIVAAVKDDLTQLDGYKAATEERDKKIQELKDSNQKMFQSLFLTQTAPAKQPEKDPAEGLEGVKALDAMSEGLRETYKDKEGIAILQH